MEKQQLLDIAPIWIAFVGAYLMSAHAHLGLAGTQTTKYRMAMALATAVVMSPALILFFGSGWLAALVMDRYGEPLFRLPDVLAWLLFVVASLLYYALVFAVLGWVWRQTQVRRLRRLIFRAGLAIATIGAAMETALILASAGALPGLRWQV